MVEYPDGAWGVGGSIVGVEKPHTFGVRRYLFLRVETDHGGRIAAGVWAKPRARAVWAHRSVPVGGQAVLLQKWKDSILSLPYKTDKLLKIISLVHHWPLRCDYSLFSFCHSLSALSTFSPLRKSKEISQGKFVIMYNIIKRFFPTCSC